MAQAKEKPRKEKLKRAHPSSKKKEMGEKKKNPAIIEELVISTKVVKAPIDIEIPEVPVDTEEKVDEDAVPVEPVETEPEEAVLDEEEIDPFGDKWEQ